MCGRGFGMRLLVSVVLFSVAVFAREPQVHFSVIGADAADTGASARVLRAGVTVVGTRPDRKIRRPDVLFIDGPRVLTSGLEQTQVIPALQGDRTELAQLVSALSSSADAPWGRTAKERTPLWPGAPRKAQRKKWWR